MKKLLILPLSLFLVACGSGVKYQQVGKQTDSENRADNLIVSSHSQTTNKTDIASKNMESPMARPIDVSEMTAEIEKAKKEYEKNPESRKAKEKLADAYFKRAFALTEAAQYRAALGDFRKGLKLKKDEEAQKMHDKILEIFASLKRQPPKEGEEPPPMPFNKQ
jgi:tetratricopeptide (TPR) repeat protein